jgi:hypothetical protein
MLLPREEKKKGYFVRDIVQQKEELMKEQIHGIIDSRSHLQDMRIRRNTLILLLYN